MNEKPIENPLRPVRTVDDRLIVQGQGPALTDAMKAELDRRIADDDASPEDGVSWDEVLAEALAWVRR